MKAKERYGQTTFSCSNISGSCNPGLASFRFVIHQWVIFQHSMSIGVYANTVKFLLTATSLQWPLQLFLISADSPYIHRYLTLSTVTTSLQRQQPLKRRLRVGPLSLSPSCVTGKKTMWKKMALGFWGAIFSCCLFTVMVDGVSEKGTAQSLIKARPNCQSSMAS